MEVLVKLERKRTSSRADYLIPPPSRRETRRKPWAGCRLLAALAILLLASAPALAADFYTSATTDLSCAGTRFGSDLICTAGEFTIEAAFSAAPGTPPFCVAGESFEFEIDLHLYGSNVDRQDVAFFAGQNGNDPRLDDAGQLCSVAVFPTGSSPWKDNDGDTCGDYEGGGDAVTNVNQIKVLCQGDSSGALEVPYVLTYWQNNGNVCTGVNDVTSGSKSKCNSGISTVSGSVKVYSGAYVDVTKQTSPDGDSQPFSFTATAADTNAKVVILKPDGTYTSDIASAGNSAGVTLLDNQTARVFVNNSAGDQTLTISEDASTHWESTASISCSQTVPASGGTMSLSVDNGAREITASGINATNIGAECTVTNAKRSRITLVKNVAGRVNATDQFRVRAIGGGTLTDDAGTSISAPIGISTSGSGTSVSTTFWSQPDQTLTFTDSATSGSLSDYTTTYSCSNTLGGSPTAMPGGSGTSFNLTPGPGDDITCTFTNQAKPTLSKGYDKNTIGAGMPATLTFMIDNPAGAIARTGLSFTDALPAGLEVAAIPNLATSGCGAVPSITTSAGAASIIANSFDLAAGASSCTISVDVTGDTAGSYVNSAAQITAISSQLRNGVTDQTLNVRQVILSKSYSPAEVFETASSTLTFTLTNGSGNPAQGNLTFTDTLTAGSGLTITGVTDLSGSGCSATTPTYNATGDPSVTLSGAGMAEGTASCSFTVTVTGNTGGTYSNSAANISGASNPIDYASLDATLNVAQLGIAKAFVPDTVDVYEPSEMTFTLTNTSSIDLTDVNFTDTLTGFYVHDTAIGGSCTGVVSAPALTAGATSLDLTVPTLSAGSSCTIVISVASSNASPTGSPYTNTTSAVTASGIGGASGSTSNTATLTVNFLPLSITKVANGSSFSPGGTIVYTIHYQNPNAQTYLSNVVFTDQIPAYTSFIAASCKTPLPSAITSCTVSTPSVGGTGTVTWTLTGNLEHGQSGDLYLSVKVD